MTRLPEGDTKAIWLLIATFLVAVSSLIYELIAATLSSYLLGDSVRQFSFVIGVFLSSMGVGAWLSRFVGDATRGFVWVQVGIGVIGGMLAPLLYFVYAFMGDIGILLYGILGTIGVLSGMEIPLIARLLKEIGAAEFRFENVLSVDYVGALVASLAFPLLIIPHLGLMSAGLAFGCLNLAVAGLSIWIFRDKIDLVLRVVWAAAFAASLLGLATTERMVSVVDAAMFEDDVILNETTPYQKINVTQFRDRTRLFLDHSIQFDTLDEHRYHETLVHPAMSIIPRARNILILGGGDGMAAREVLKHTDVEKITLVDLDPRITELFREHPQLKVLNSGSLNDPRVEIIAEDAWRFIEADTAVYDAIIIDLPDPKSIALSKLYSSEFYAFLMERLSPYGALVTQSGSPLFARDAFWSVVETLEMTRNPSDFQTPLIVIPYHVYVPSFGDWGFGLVLPQGRIDRSIKFPLQLKFMTENVWESAQVFAADVDRTDVEPNSIKTHKLVNYYQDGWDYWFK
ncbi:polyamine aminopropyltransferase [Sulfitobacter sp.]|uniref:polyamine aminopropyltransferase n=1 Tax=Sulfitobacter sp. TaxID=1903071 RepID=UPI003002BF65